MSGYGGILQARKHTSVVIIVKPLIENVLISSERLLL